MIEFRRIRQRNRQRRMVITLKYSVPMSWMIWMTRVRVAKSRWAISPTRRCAGSCLTAIHRTAAAAHEEAAPYIGDVGARPAEGAQSGAAARTASNPRRTRRTSTAGRGHHRGPPCRTHGHPARWSRTEVDQTWRRSIDHAKAGDGRQPGASFAAIPLGDRGLGGRTATTRTPTVAASPHQWPLRGERDATTVGGRIIAHFACQFCCKPRPRHAQQT